MWSWNVCVLFEATSNPQNRANINMHPNNERIQIKIDSFFTHKWNSTGTMQISIRFSFNDYVDRDHLVQVILIETNEKKNNSKSNEN